MVKKIITATLYRSHKKALFIPQKIFYPMQ